MEKMKKGDGLQEEREKLPIYAHKEEIAELVKNNLYCIITGETGSGKTTQVPQFIFDFLSTKDIRSKAGEIFTKSMNEKQDFKQMAILTLGPEAVAAEKDQIVKHPEQEKEKEDKGKLSIVITQPRRVAAIQLSKRVARERGSKLGDEIGYVIRFEDHASAKTRIKYVTDGILVRECLEDRDLKKYDIVILDEAHERSLHTDILFALIKQAVIRRKGTLHLVVTSATLDIKKFSKFFFDCPILEVQGRCYPVAVYHGTCQKEKRIDNCVKAALRIHMTEGPGDILIFLTGFEECEQAVQLCYHKLEELQKRGKSVPSMMIVPLYGAMQTEEQSLAFEKPPPNCRKVVFSTNIAETSLTVDGIAFVIDAGFVKQKQYNPQTGMDSLMVIPISKVQAVQRTGRAGRTGPGKCYRLYTEPFFTTQMADITTPEIQRVNLSNTILTLKNIGVDDVVNFDFIDPPEKESIIQALKALYLIRAIAKDGSLTPLGKEICKLPLEPSYSKTLISSVLLGCEDEVLKIVSLLSAENVWQTVSINDAKRRTEFEREKKELSDSGSDHLSLANIFTQWLHSHKSESWCRKHFLRSRALFQANNIYQQLKDSLQKINLTECSKFILTDKKHIKDKDGRSHVGLSFCQGFFMNVCRKLPEEKEVAYLAVNDGHLAQLDHGSSLSLNKNYPDWILYTEISGTSKSKAIIKMACEVKLEWIEDMLPLLKNVDTFLLAKLKVEEKVIELPKKREPVDKLEQEQIENLQKEEKEKEKQKLELAKSRYLKRKKFE